MRFISMLSTLVCSLGLMLSAGNADARIQGEGFCERQLDNCLRRSRIPEPCYWDYEACISGSPYAPISNSGTGRLAFRD